MRLLLALVFLLTGCQPLSQVACLPSAEARLFLSDLMGQAPSSGPTLERSTVTYEVEGRSRSATIYRPAEAPQAGLVLVPGAVQAGGEDPRLMALAQALARRRFAVLVPDLASVRALRLSPEDAVEVADAFAYLASRPDLAPAGRAGMAGISYAFGPAVLAALMPRVREQVRFLLGVGPYHDMTRVLTYLTTGHHREGTGPWRHLAPSGYLKWLFVLSHIEHFEDPSDRETLRSLAGRLERDPIAETSDLRERLRSDEARALLELLDNRAPERVPALMTRLPASIRADMAALDLSDKDLSAIRARTILIHGTEDAMIPYTEGLALARALPGDRTRLFVVNGLSHVDFQEPGFWDAWSLGCAADAFLDERRR